MALDRIVELAAVLEGVPGTLESGAYAAANAKFLVIDPSVEYAPRFFSRDFKRASLTGIDGIPGIKTGTMSFTIEVGGHEVTTPSIPPWKLLLNACGFTDVNTKQVTASTAFTGGPLYHGETVAATDVGVGTGATGTAKVVHDTFPDASGVATLFITNDALTLSTGDDTLLTGATSGATYTVPSGGSVAEAGRSWYPTSQEVVRLTHSGATPAIGSIVTQAENGAGGVVLSNPSGASLVRLYTPAMFDEAYEVVVAGGTNISAVALTATSQETNVSISLSMNLDGTIQQPRGARGNVEFTGNVGEPMLMRFTFQGIAVDPSDSALLSGVMYESKVPPTMLGIGLTVGHEGDDDSGDFFSPCAAAITVNMNNEVAERTCVNDAAGLEAFTITARDVSGTIDPEKTLEANFPWIQDFLDGDIWRADWTVGSTAGNKFKFSMPGLQTTAAPHGERSGQLVRNLAFRATGGHQNDNATGSDLYGEDNEIVLTYITATNP